MGSDPKFKYSASGDGNRYQLAFLGTKRLWFQVLRMNMPTQLVEYILTPSPELLASRKKISAYF